MKVLFLTQTTADGPSSRYRVFQLLPRLRKLGIEADVSPAIDEDSYRQIYREGGGWLPKARAFWRAYNRRLDELPRLGYYDAVFAQKGLLPGISLMEAAFARGRPLVFDFDDAIWLPRVAGNPLLRTLHRESRVQTVLRRAAAVIAGNEYLADYARRFNPRVTVVPSAIDIGRYSITPPLHQSAAPVIGWIGSRTTLPYLKPLEPVFRELGVTPRVIAAGDPSPLGFPVDFVDWQPDTEIRELQSLDIGINPLPDTPWEQGKCGVKTLQYMAAGLPVVASPVGVNSLYVRDGITGFHARTTAEWCDRLRKLIADAALRQRLGQAGRQRVEAEFTVRQAAAKVAEVLRAVLGHR